MGKCTKCGDSESKGKSFNRLPGDWICFHFDISNPAKEFHEFSINTSLN